MGSEEIVLKASLCEKHITILENCCSLVPFTKKHKGNGFRAFLAIFLLATFTLTVGYRGTLISFLTVAVPPKPLDTIAELAFEDDR